MRISKLIIDESKTNSKGLQKINLYKKSFGELVALVGKNGAGKSRILDIIKDYIKNVDADDLLDQQLIYIPKEVSGSYNNRVNEAINEFQKTGLSIDEFFLKERNHARALNTIASNVNKLGSHYIKVIDSKVLTSIKQSLQTKNGFKDIIDYISGNFDFTSSSKPVINEFDYINSNSTISILQDIADKCAIDRLIHLKEIDEKQKSDRLDTSVSNKNFQIIKKYIKTFLGKDLSFDENFKGNVLSSNLTLDSSKFEIDILSPGEKTLFAYAMLFAFYEIYSSLNPKHYIIIIDEPELHLHPGAQVQLIDALRRLVKNTGQLWVATHSLAIISHLEYNEIMLVKDNQLLPPSTDRLEEIFRDLMVVDEHREELHEFISSLSDWAYSRFIFQCFRTPEIITASNKNDPQYQLFKKFISSSNSIKFLDFGAGHGRVLKLINEDDDLAKKIQYSAYEPNKKFKNELEEIADSYYDDVDSIPKKEFNVVLLCNVLHEIEVTEWVETLNKIKGSLKDDGYLIIIEDLHLPKGENANKFGYVILDSEYLDDLMGFEDDSNAIVLKHENPRYKDRLVFYAVKKGDVNTNIQCVWNAVARLSDDLLEKIKDIRFNDNDVKNARLYANYSQLYINSLLASQEVKKVMESTK